MRIALVSREYPPETAHGGIGSQTFLKAHGLTARGHETVVVSASVDKDRHDSSASGVRVVRVPTGEVRLPLYTDAVEWLTYSVEVARELASLHAQTAFDLIAFPEWGGEGYIHLLNRTEWNWMPPVVIQLHGPIVMFAHAIGWPELDSEFFRTGSTMEATCLRLADGIYSSSSCSADWAARHYGLKRETIPTLHTGVDTRWFTPRTGDKESRPTIVFVGRVTDDKGVTMLVDAACRLTSRFPNLQLQICGRETKLIGQLQAMAQAVGAPDLLQFLGFVGRDNLPSVLSRAHVFAGPSTYEPGPGLVYLEAMACGVPVVACSGAGAAEVVAHERNGLLVPPRDVDALTDALERLLSDERYRAELAVQARKYAVDEADSEICLTRIESFYTAAAAKRYGLS